jgi:hypothetical protein
VSTVRDIEASMIDARLDPDAAFDAIDEEIADLVDRRAGCRRAVAASRAAIIAGALVLLLSAGLPALRAPTILIAALTAMIGGTVWAGASKSSGEELDARLADAEARKAEMIDRVAAANGWRDLTPTVH